MRHENIEAFVSWLEVSNWPDGPSKIFVSSWLAPWTKPILTVLLVYKNGNGILNRYFNE